jgi:hypothetical protein
MRRRLLAVLLAMQFTLAAAGQGTRAEDQDAVAIRNAIELYMSPDPARVKEAFYPSANLYSEDGKGGLRIIPLDLFLTNLAKGAASGQSRPTMTIDFIDHAGSAATARMTEISDAARVIDYFSLVRDATGWRIVSKTFNVERKTEASGSSSGAMQASVTTPCPSGELQALYFLAGNWSTTESPVSSDGAITGTSRTEKILNGCALWEHRFVEQKGKELFDAHIVLGHDVTTKKMLLFYVDDGSHTQVYEGRHESGGWVFYRKRPGDGGQTILIRVTYAQKGKGFTQTVERSKDRGHSWEVASVTSYLPKS